MIGNLAAFAGVAAAQRLARALCRVAGVPWSQPVEWVGGPWCAIPDGRRGGHEIHRLHYLDAWFGVVEVSRPESVFIVRHGPIVAAVEWAPDGGGTVRGFLARDELTGGGAAEMMRWHAAQEARWEREVWNG